MCIRDRFCSFFICLEAVPDDTREWKPETAPQAIVTKKIGNRYCGFPFASGIANAVKASRLQEMCIRDRNGVVQMLYSELQCSEAIHKAVERMGFAEMTETVSYTHLDVYKRQ